MKRSIIAALAIVAMAGCTKDSNEMNDVGSSAVEFTIGDIAAQSRAEVKSTWAEDGSDKVGIYTDDDTYINIGYSVGSGGALSADGEKIYYTSQDSPTTFYAYYPYDSSVVGYKIPIDVSDQTQMIDLLVSEKVSDTQNSAKGVVFTFSHVLSSVEITISGSDMLSDLSTLSVWTESVVTDATYSFLSTSNNISLGTSASKLTLDVAAIEGDGEGRYLAQAILLPNDYTSTTIYFSFVDSGGLTRLFSQEIGKAFASGYKYTYDATLGLSYEEFSMEATGELTWGDETESEGVESTKFDIVFDDDTYYIQSAKGLRAFADLVNGYGENSSGATTFGDAAAFDFTGTTDNSSINGKLMADINLEGDDSNQWTPIGTGNANGTYPFTGTFDGNNNKIKGLYINDSSVYYQGLFGCINGATIQNISVDGELCAGEDAGGIVGYAESGATISNCHSSVYVRPDTSAGGIVGSLYEGVFTIINCSNTGVVGSNDGHSAGGIVASVGNTVQLLTITNCYNGGDVYSFGAYCIVGGIVAYTIVTTTITNCYSSGGLESYTPYIGGIVGDISSESPIPTLKNCYWESTVADGIEDLTNTTDSEAMSATDMQAASFVTMLNNGAYTYNNDGSPEVKAYGWVATSGGYPALDASVTPILTPDIAYVSGTYEINTAKGMRAFADLVNGAGSNSSEALTSGDAAYFDFTSRNVSINGKLMADINLEGDDSNQWTPIGTDSSSKQYAGKFDGGGYTISGLYINANQSCQGLFGVATNATIENVTLSNVTVKLANSPNSLGSLVGKLYGGTISNCHTINGGSVTTDIQDSSIGGLIGVISDNSATIINCSNSAAVTYNNSNSSTDSAGGIVGVIYTTTTISNCYNSSLLSSNSGYTALGGIVGYCSFYGSDILTITNCYNIKLPYLGDAGFIIGIINIQFDTASVVLNYCYGSDDLVGSGEDNCTLNNCEEMTDANMQLTTFGDLLTTNAATIDGAYAWEQVAGYYPTLTTTLAKIAD